MVHITSYSSYPKELSKYKIKELRKEQLTTGIPQESFLDPVLLIIYVADLLQIKENHLPDVKGYANEHQVIAIENCVAERRSWMISNMLMVNDSKTEYLIVGSKQQVERVNISFIHVGEDQITPVTSVRNMGVILYSNLKMDMKITKACQNAYYHLHNIKRIRNSWARKPHARSYMHLLQARLTTATVWWNDYQIISSRNPSVWKTLLPD